MEQRRISKQARGRQIGVFYSEKRYLADRIGERLELLGRQIAELERELLQYQQKVRLTLLAPEEAEPV